VSPKAGQDAVEKRNVSCPLRKLNQEYFVIQPADCSFNPLALELDIYSLAHHLCETWIFYEPRRV